MDENKTLIKVLKLESQLLQEDEKKMVERVFCLVKLL